MRNVADPIVRYGNRRRIKGAGRRRHAEQRDRARECQQPTDDAGVHVQPTVTLAGSITFQRRLHYRLLGPVTLDHERAAIEGERDALKGGARQRGLSDHGRPPRRPDRRPSARRSSSRPRSRCRQSRWCWPSLGLGGTHIPARSCVLLEGVAREVCRDRGAVSSALAESPTLGAPYGLPRPLRVATNFRPRSVVRASGAGSGGRRASSSASTSWRRRAVA
jgi:hypothetical protein